MKHGIFGILFCCAFFAAALRAPGQFDTFVPVGAEEKSESARLFSAKALAEFTTVTAGQEFHVALIGEIAPGWVYYGPIPAGPAKGAGLDVKSVAQSPSAVAANGKGKKDETFVAARVLWPATTVKPTDIGTGIADMNVYKKRVVVYASLKTPASARLGTISITLQPRGQLCKDSCIDIQPAYGQPITAELTVRVGDKAVANPKWAGPIKAGLAEARTIEQIRAHISTVDRAVRETQLGTARLQGFGFWAAIGVALLAGLALNIMPCVLPVIPIRILSIVQLAGESRRRFVTMGLAFAGGMLLFFVAIAAGNVALKLTVGRSFDLNEGFQRPAVIITLAMIVVALAANLFGIFNVIVPGRVMAVGQGAEKSKRNPHLKSVGMGVMMAILATPCSFAFLAAALTYAQMATLTAGTLVILAVGLGMSLPHAMLAGFPGLVEKLPKPGRWMEIFKQSTGFVLLLVAAWLISTLRGDGPSYPFWILAWAVIFVMCLWMWAGWVRYDAPLRKKLAVRSLAVVLAVASGWWMLTPPAPPLIKAEKFDWLRIQQARQAGRVVMVKFSAPWCTKCLQQEATVFNKPEVAEATGNLDVYYVKADVSRYNTPAAKWMHEQGYGVKIPMTLIFPPKGPSLPPLRSELTPEMLIEKLQAAKRANESH